VTYGMISKKGSAYVLKSHTTGKTLGKFKTKAEAVKREKQIQYFKSKKSSSSK